MKLGLILHKEFPELSVAETKVLIEKFLNGKILNSTHNFVEAEISDNPENLLIVLNRSAYIKKAIRLIASAKDSAELEKELLKGKLDFLKSEFTKPMKFRMTLKNLEHTKRSFANMISFGKALALYPFVGSVDLKNPELDFHILNSGKINLGILIWENKEDFQSRRADKRPANHPTSMSPRIARCLVNLTGAESEVLDPFCGAGGFLIEAGIIGLKVYGSDIDSEMIERARKNLAHFNINADLIVQDALLWTKTVKAVVTDVPYGKSSKLNTSLGLLIKNFVRHYETLTKTIVLVYPDRIQDGFLKGTSWKKMREFSIYVHSTLTRKIVILKHN